MPPLPTDVAELHALLAAKDAQISELVALVEKLSARVEELERRQGRDSSKTLMAYSVRP
jgi:hypothetical protein